MKHSFYILLLMWIFLSACEDVIQLDLEEGTTELVVDAWINNLPEKQVIKLRTTSPYLDNNFSPPVLGATVRVFRSDSTSFEFIDENNDGNYTWDGDGEVIGEPGQYFGLNIIVDELNYNAISQMQVTTPVDTIQCEYRNSSSQPAGYYAEFFARDLPGLGNTYWIKTYRNGRFLNNADEINIAYDAGVSEGAEVDGLIFVSPIREAINRVTYTSPPYRLDDSLSVEIHSIPYDAFLYLRMVRAQLLISEVTIFAEPPANIPSNIITTDRSKSPQGFFAVSAVERKSLIVGE